MHIYWIYYFWIYVCSLVMLVDVDKFHTWILTLDYESGLINSCICNYLP